MITLTNVFKQYRRVSAIKNLSFKVEKGEIIGLLGLNGAGKTTTMRLITGIIQPSSGTVSINQHDPIKDHLAVASTMGYLPENNPLYQDMLVEEYLLMIKDIKHVTNSDYFITIIKQTGLSEYLKRRIDTLSRGYRQRVGLAAALLGDPSIIILDEPTSGLDPIEQEKIRELIRDLGRDKTIFFSTHILSEVEEIATRLLILHEGTLVYDGTNPKKKGSVDALFKHYVS